MLITKTKDLLEDCEKINFSEVIADFLIGRLNIYQIAVLRFSNPEGLESFVKGNAIKTTAAIIYNNEKPDAEKVMGILKRKAQELGYYVEILFYGEDHAVYQKFTIH